jgi:hypothetical protein
MIIHSRLFVSTFIIAILYCASISAALAGEPLQATPPGQPIHVSLIQLIADPAAYDGKLVRVEGYLHDKFEDSALYLSKEQADFLIGYNAVWVNYVDKNLSLQGGIKNPQRQYFDCRNVLLEGIFDKKGHGHRGMFSGELKAVNRVLELTRWFDGKTELRK